jgi:hypothetical protein
MAGDIHFYSVLDLIETHGMKIIQCKSPFKRDKRLLKFAKDSDKLPMPFKVSLLFLVNYI